MRVGNTVGSRLMNSTRKFKLPGCTVHSAQIYFVRYLETLNRKNDISLTWVGGDFMSPLLLCVETVF